MEEKTKPDSKDGADQETAPGTADPSEKDPSNEDAKDTQGKVEAEGMKWNHSSVCHAVVWLFFRNMQYRYSRGRVESRRYFSEICNICSILAYPFKPKTWQTELWFHFTLFGT